MVKATCKACGYGWEPRILKPKSCPRCKARLDAPPKKRATLTGRV